MMFLRIATILLAVSALPVQADPPVLGHVYPAGGKVGSTVTVNFGGTLKPWPVKVWTSSEKLKFEPQKKSGEMSVTVADDASPGVYLVRVFNDDGASDIRPFVVGIADEIVEKEPNNKISDAMKIELPVVVNGQLAKRGDHDAFAVNVKKGQTLVVRMLAHRPLGSPMDGIIQIASDKGFVLAQNDDGPNLDPYIVFDVPQDGTYLIRVFAFPEVATSSISYAGAANFVYRLDATTSGYLDHTIPLVVAKNGSTDVRLNGWNLAKDKLAQKVSAGDGDAVVIAEPGNGRSLSLPVFEGQVVVAQEDQASQTVPLPVSISGTMDAKRDVDTFTFAMKKGQALNINAYARSLDSPMDPVIRVTDPTGKVVKEIDDHDRTKRDALINLRATEDGEHKLEIWDLHGQWGTRYYYRMDIQEQRPTITLKLGIQAVTVKAGGEVKIPVDVVRGGGFNDKIKLTANDLPPGITCEAVESDTKGASAKKVELKLVAAKDAESYSGLIKVIGQGVKLADVRGTAMFEVTGPSILRSDCWLTVVGSNDKSKEPIDSK